MKRIIAFCLLSSVAFAGVTRERRPEIYLEYGSRDAAISKVTFVVDGVDVSDKAKVGPSRASYTPTDDLSIGEHHVEVTVSDEKGRVRTKKWSFTVDPNAKDAEPPVIEFAGPTPANGEVRVPSKTWAAIRVTDAIAGVDPASVKVWLTTNGGAPKEVTLVRQGDLWSVELGALGSGTYLLKACAADKDGNRAPDLWRGFAMDGDAPIVARVSLAPDPVTLPGPATILVEVDDKPFGEVRDVQIEIAGRKLKGPAVRRLAAIPWDLRDGAGKYVAAGKIAAKITATDFGGLTGETTATLDVRGEAPVEGDVPLRLDAVKPVTTTSPISVSGGTRAGAEVELFVNGRPTGTKVAAGGAFTFDRVDLEPGLNRITAVARDLAKHESSAVVTASTTFKTAGSETVQATGAGPTAGTGATATGDVPLAIDPPPAATERETTTLTGTSTPGATVEVTVNGRPAGTGTADRAGRVSIADVALAAGTNTIRVTSRSGADRPATQTFTVARGGKAPPPREESPHRP